MAKKFIFHGKEYKYIRSRKLKDKSGYCVNPNFKKKRRIISVEACLRDKDELEINIHEFMHACGWFADEEWISESALDIANALWELGYRKDESIKTRKEGSN